MGRVGSSPTGRTGWPFGVGLAKIEYVNVSVAELADALDLGSSAFGRVGSSPTGHTGGKGGSCISLLPLAFRSCYSGWARLAGLTQLVECSSCKRDAGGSSPPSGSGVDGGA